MRKFIGVLLVLTAVMILALLSPAHAMVITYTTQYANVNDAPIYGKMIDPSDYYNVDSGDKKTAGDALDNRRVWIWDWGYQGGAFQMMKWDMGFATNFARVYQDAENGFQNNGHDYLEWSLWGSNNPSESNSAWTLLWDPLTTGSGNSVQNLVAGSVTGSANSVNVYRYGTNLNVGTVYGDAYSDAFTMDYYLAESYRYFGIRTSTLAFNSGDPDPEMNAVATRNVPEPGTMFLLGSLASGLFGFAGLRKRFTR
jgi:hypothetical protein